MVRDIPFAEIQVGDKASMSKTISDYDVYGFAGITGDFNPVHINDEFAKNIAEHSELPYTDWWMNQDLYSFIGTKGNGKNKPFFGCSKEKGRWIS